jgi:hypothetical protein
MAFFKSCWTWLQQLVMLPRNLAKVADIDRYLECEKQLAETKQRLQEAKDQLSAEAMIKEGQMIFCDNVLWAKGPDGKIEETPYCPHCFKLNGKTFFLIARQNALEVTGDCPECKVRFPIRRKQQPPKPDVWKAF